MGTPKTRARAREEETVEDIVPPSLVQRSQSVPPQRVHISVESPQVEPFIESELRVGSKDPK